MINSLTRPAFFDENGHYQQTGERFWNSEYKSASVVTIRIPYDGNMVNFRNATPVVSENPFFTAADITFEVYEHEQESEEASFHIFISRKTQSASQYWTSEWDDIQFINCNQDDDYYSRTQIEDDKVWISAQVNSNAASKGYVQIELFDVHAHIIRIPGPTSSNTVNLQVSNAWGSFHGHLYGAAETAYYTRLGKPIGCKTYQYVLQIRVNENMGDMQEYRFITLTLLATEKYGSTLTLKQLFTLLKNQGYYYTNINNGYPFYTPPCLPVTISEKARTQVEILNANNYSGYIWAQEEDTGHSVDQLICIYSYNSTSIAHIKVYNGNNSDTVAVLKCTEF